MDLERRPWWHKESLYGMPKMENAELRNFREKHSRTPVQSDRQLRDLIANYYGMISLIDHNVGRILAALDAYGLADNTLVVYSTDHGDWLGDHGLILKGPMAYEGLLRVGLLVRGPGVPQGQGGDRAGLDPRPAGDLRRLCRRLARRRAPQPSLKPLIERRRLARLRLLRMGPARLALRRRPVAAHGAHQDPQAHAREQLRRGRALRPGQRSAGDGQPLRRPGVARRSAS